MAGAVDHFIPKGWRWISHEELREQLWARLGSRARANLKIQQIVQRKVFRYRFPDANGNFCYDLPNPVSEYEERWGSVTTMQVRINVTPLPNGLEFLVPDSEITQPGDIPAPDIPTSNVPASPAEVSAAEAAPIAEPAKLADISLAEHVSQPGDHESADTPLAATKAADLNAKRKGGQPTIPDELIALAQADLKKSEFPLHPRKPARERVMKFLAQHGIELGPNYLDRYTFIDRNIFGPLEGKPSKRKP
jgi:hypothetical protein